MPASKPLPGWGKAVLVLVLLLGFFLRLHDLAGPSLWSEEGLNLLRATQPAGLTFAGEIQIAGEVVQDNVGLVPPLMLHIWQAVTGEGVFTGRFLSVVAGVLAIPLLYQVGRVLAGRRIALGTAFLLAISPYHVWLSREIGYEAVLLQFTLVMAYTGARLLFSPLSRSGRVAMISILIAALILVLAALPRWPVNPSLTFLFIPSRSIFTHAAGLLGTGVARDLVQQWWRYLPAVVLAVAGGLAGWRANRRVVLCILIYLLGVLLALGLSARQSIATPAYRLIFLALPPFLTLVAWGWLYPWQKWRGRALLLGLAVVAIQFWWWGQQIRAPELVKDDVRALAAELSVLARPGDAVVIQDAGTLAAFTQYYQGQARWFLLPAHTDIVTEPGVSSLMVLGDSAERIWLITAPRPRTGFPANAMVETAQEWPFLLHRDYQWLWLPLEMALYATRPEVAVLPPEMEPIGIDWNGELVLEAFDLPAQVISGEWWQPRFVWRKTAAAEGQYTLFVRLTDDAGKTWAVQEWLLWEDYPPGFWPVDTLVQYDPVLAFPAGLPPGNYQATLQVVRTRDGQPLTYSGGTDLPLGQLAVQVATAPAGLEALPAFTGKYASFGRELTLLGFDIPNQVDYRPGHPIPVTLVWQADNAPRQDYRLRLELLDREGAVVQEVVTAPVQAGYPPTEWPAGALLAVTHDLLVPATAVEGRYTVQVSVLPADSDRPVRSGGLLGDERVLLTDITVLPWPLETAFPLISNPVRADFGRPAQELHGYALEPEPSRPGDSFALILFWRAGAPTEEGYTVFVHVTDGAGNLVAQGDGVPVNGIRPTTSWRSGEALVDTHAVKLPPELPAGNLSLWVGFYDPENGTRLPVTTAGETQADDRLLLTEFVIE